MGDLLSKAQQRELRPRWSGTSCRRGRREATTCLREGDEAGAGHERERDGIEGEMALREEEIEPEARAAQESDGEGESEVSVEARLG